MIRIILGLLLVLVAIPTSAATWEADFDLDNWWSRPGSLSANASLGKFVSERQEVFLKASYNDTPSSNAVMGAAWVVHAYPPSPGHITPFVSTGLNWESRRHKLFEYAGAGVLWNLTEHVGLRAYIAHEFETSSNGFFVSTAIFP